jgi:hypothetical protein
MPLYIIVVYWLDRLLSRADYRLLMEVWGGICYLSTIGLAAHSLSGSCLDEDVKARQWSLVLLIMVGGPFVLKLISVYIGGE